MIDVFSVSLIFVVYAVQNEYVSASIPDGIIDVGQYGFPSAFGSKEEHVHFFSGMYLVVGAGIAAVFLRWFWSSSAGVYRKKSASEMKRLDVYQHVPMLNLPGGQVESAPSPLEDEYVLEEGIITRYVAGKSCRGLTIWTVVCLLLHGLPPDQQHFQLDGMNQALANSMPLLNKLLAKYSPQTVGSCIYPATGIPQPCYEYGILDKEMLDVFRVTAEWMSGINTITLFNVSILRRDTFTAQNATSWSSPAEALPTILHRYTLNIKGVIAKPHLFLRMEECPKNHTSLGPIIGEGLCKPFLDTAESCCEADRSFEVQIAAECHLGDSGLRNFQVSDMRMDTMTVKPEMWRGRVKLLIADKNITDQVLANVKGNIMWYLTEEPLLNFGGQEMNMVNFLNRVLRFNAPHEEFHCR
jgi:hypothetical protein